MPSEPALPLTGRCYCGKVRLRIDAAPKLVAHCHCSDCRRWTGAAVGTFAAFAASVLQADPGLPEPLSIAPGVERWTCKACGSPLAARFDYLPGQVYVPIGLLDQADQMPASIECHHDARLPWLELAGARATEGGSARDSLNAAGQ